MNSISAVLIAAFVLLPASGQPRGRSLVSAQSPKSDDFHIRLAPAQRQQLFAGQCTLITSTAALPASVKTMFASATGEPTFALANPGQKYQETDVIIGRKLPRRRLVFAGQCGERYFIHYERGGLAHNYEVLIFQTDPKGSLRFAWGGAGFYRAATIDDLSRAVTSGKFADDQPNW